MLTNMWNIIILIIGALICAGGVICIYDARSITNRMFGFGDQNEATLGLKMIGFVIAMIGAVIILLNY